MRNLRDTVFYRKTNLLQDFRICISVPLITHDTDKNKSACIFVPNKNYINVINNNIL